MLFILFYYGVALHFEKVFHVFSVVAENCYSVPLRHPVFENIFRFAVCRQLASASVFAACIAARNGRVYRCPPRLVAYLNSGKLFSAREDYLNGSALFILRVAAQIVLTGARVVLAVNLAASNAVGVYYLPRISVYNRVGNLARSARKVKGKHCGKRGVYICFANSYFAVVCHLVICKARVHMAAFAVNIVI